MERRASDYFAKHPVDIVSHTFEDDIRNALRRIADPDDLAAEVLSDIFRKVRSSVGVARHRKQYMDDVKNMILATILNGLRAQPFYDLANSRIHDQFYTDHTDTISSISRRLVSLGLPELKSLERDYKPPHIKDTSDHGVASGLFAICLKDLIASMCARSFGTKTEEGLLLSRVFSLVFHLGAEGYNDDIRHRYTDLFDEVIQSVLVHNLYPVHLKSLACEKFRVDIEKSPFDFFCTLVDSLQRWDRDKRIWQSQDAMPYKTTSGNFNIEIEDDAIKIYEYGVDVDIISLAAKIKYGLDSFLKGGRHYVWLSVGQWKQ